MAPHILIVEDEDCLLEVLRYNFEKAGYLVESVSNGDRADALLKEITPDLVLLDWVLPGLASSCADACGARRPPRPCPSSCSRRAVMRWTRC